MSPIRRRSGPESLAEAVATVRAAVLHQASRLPVPVLLMAGPGRGAGRTRICAEVAVSMARAGHRVVAVDMDLRQPALHGALGSHAGPGVWDVLAAGAEPADCIQPVGAAPGLGLLAAGSRAGEPTDVLAGPAVGPLLRDLAGRADLVLVDTPPLPAVADALAVAPHAGGAVLVLDCRRTRLVDAEAARAAFDRAGLAVIGAVVNRPRR